MQERGNEVIVISSPESDGKGTALLDTTDLRLQLSELRRQRRSDLRQLAFWAETVAKLGEEVSRPPTQSETKKQEKLVASGDWVPHMSLARDVSFRELGCRFTDMYQALWHSLPPDYCVTE